MAWKKANGNLIKLLEENAMKYRCDRKMMFGSPTFFVNNNMFAGVHEDTVILRLSEEDRKEMESLHSEAKPFTPMGAHVMKEYVALPESFCGKTEIFHRWFDRSYRYAVALPAKKPRASKKRVS